MVQRLNSKALIPSGDTARNKSFNQFNNQKQQLKGELKASPGQVSFTLDQKIRFLFWELQHIGLPSVGF